MDRFIRSALGVSFLLDLLPIIHTEQIQEFCPWETFSPSCLRDEVLLIEMAKYGRMNLGRCIQYDLGYIGCFSDVLHVVDSLCSGRQSCNVRVPNPEFDKLQACSEMKRYFEVSYKCVPVVVRDKHLCQSTRPVIVDSKQGYLSSSITSRTGCGGMESPWIIQGISGQQINITLWNFGFTQQSKRQGSFLSSSACLKYATLTEKSNGETFHVQVCETVSRQRHVYKSTGTVLEVVLHITSDESPVFMLEFEVIGCPDPEHDESIRYSRKENLATFQCISTSQSWTRKCVANKWEGESQHCGPESNALQIVEKMKMSPTISIVIIVSLSLLIGAIIVTCGMLFLCRQQRVPRSDIPLVGPPVEDDRNPYASRIYFKQYSNSANSEDALRLSRDSNEYASICDRTPQIVVPSRDDHAQGFVRQGSISGKTEPGRPQHLGYFRRNSLDDYRYACGLLPD